MRDDIPSIEIAELLSEVRSLLARLQKVGTSYEVLLGQLSLDWRSIGKVNLLEILRTIQDDLVSCSGEATLLLQRGKDLYRKLTDA